MYFVISLSPVLPTSHPFSVSSHFHLVDERNSGGNLNHVLIILVAFLKVLTVSCLRCDLSSTAMYRNYVLPKNSIAFSHAKK